MPVYHLFKCEFEAGGYDDGTLPDEKEEYAFRMLANLTPEDKQHQVNEALKKKLFAYKQTLTGTKVSNNQMNKWDKVFESIIKHTPKQLKKIKDWKNGFNLSIFVSDRDEKKKPSRKRTSISSAASSSSASKKHKKSAKKKKPIKKELVRKTLGEESSSGGDDDDDDDDDDDNKYPTMSQFQNEVEDALDNNYGDIEEEPDKEEYKKKFDDMQKVAHRLLAQVKDLKKKLKVCKNHSQKIQDVFAPHDEE